MSACDLLQWTPQDRIDILREYGRTVDSVEQDVRSMKEWLCKQRHLPEVPNDYVIERFLVVNKFRFEKARHCIDTYYSIRNIIPDIYDQPVTSQAIQSTFDIYYSFSLPRLFEHKRITFFKLIDFDTSKYDPQVFITREMYMGEVRIAEDYDAAQITVVDLEGYSMMHILKCTPKALKTIAFVLENVYANNIRGIHLINAPQLANLLLTTLKSYFAPKIFERIFIHKNIDTLVEHIPPHYLPTELGGNDFSLQDLNGKWKEKLLSYLPRYEALEKLKIDENLREKKLQYSCEMDMFGRQGNFRKLTVD